MNLTPEQVDAYRRDGYLIVPGPIFPPDAFAALKDKCAATFADRAAQRGGVEPSLVDCPHWSDPEIFAWVFADEMLDLVEPLIGPDIAVFACHFLQKPPEIGKPPDIYWDGEVRLYEAKFTTGPKTLTLN